MTPDPLPLAGLRVLEFSHAVLGPACGVILADLGADVIKVEPAPAGDPTRQLQGFGMGYFPMFNRNKRSIALNLKTDAGQVIVHKLLKDTDVLIENFGPGTMDRLGLGYEPLKEDYPCLIYASLKGFLPGPYENRTALDEVVQMMSGLAYMTGPPGNPLRAGASVVDITTGMFGAMGVMMALRDRDKSGQGQFVKSALFETASYLMGHHMAYSAISGLEVPPMPARVSAWAIYHQFETRSGARVFVGVTSDKQWARFCDLFERKDWLEDERLATNNARIAARDWFLPALRAMLAEMEISDVIARCEQAQLPFSPIARPEDLFTDPQLNQGGSLLETDLLNGETANLPRLPFLVGQHAFDIQQQPPTIGAHTREILQGLAYSQDDISSLFQSEVVA